MSVHDFSEKINLFSTNLTQLEQATDQVRKSQTLKDIFQFVLALGNHLNQNISNLSQACGFRLNILPQLDQTKINGNQSNVSLLNVIVYACQVKYGDDWFEIFNVELGGVEAASKSNERLLFFVKSYFKHTISNID